MLRLVDTVACLSTSSIDFSFTGFGHDLWIGTVVSRQWVGWTVLPMWFHVLRNDFIIMEPWLNSDEGVETSTVQPWWSSVLSEWEICGVFNSLTRSWRACQDFQISLKPPWILIELVEKRARYWRTWVGPDFPVQWTHFCFAETHRTKWTQNRTSETQSFGFCKNDQWFLCVYVTTGDNHLSNLKIENDGINRQT